MYFDSEFIFKGIKKSDGGSFVNTEGKTIEYPACYKLSLDYLSEEGEAQLIVLKIPENNTALVDKLKNLKVYQKICLRCNVVIYGSNAKVVPIDLIRVDSNNK